MWKFLTLKKMYLVPLDKKQTTKLKVLTLSNPIELATNGTLNEFASATSTYKKIVGNADNYTYYSSRCRGELPC